MRKGKDQGKKKEDKYDITAEFRKLPLPLCHE
jgi:hypothetical protein